MIESDSTIRLSVAAIEQMLAAQPQQKIVLPGQTPQGQHILGVLIKRTYGIVPGKRCERAAVDRKLIPGDKHYGDPMTSTVEFESDYVPFKIGTDVVLNGAAHAPAGRPVQTLVAALTVGSYRKELLVIGDRHCLYRRLRDPQFTEPAPFVSMELRYERAYGGVDVYSDLAMPCAYPRNHLGRGFAVTNAKRAIDRLALPNLEDPKNLLTPERLAPGHFMYWEHQPLPQGFGWYSKFWQPRAALAGVMPADRLTAQELRTAYGQLVPPEQQALYAQTELPEMNFAFFNGASPGLAVPLLRGDEEVRLTNLAPEGALSFWLPGVKPLIGLDLGRGMQTPEVALHTVMIRMADKQLDLVWRAAVPYPGPDWLPEMKKMDVMVR